nr:unnamed protein product [Digitaria exilis]
MCYIPPQRQGQTQAKQRPPTHSKQFPPQPKRITRANPNRCRATPRSPHPADPPGPNPRTSKSRQNKIRTAPRATTTAPRGEEERGRRAYLSAVLRSLRTLRIGGGRKN